MRCSTVSQKNYVLMFNCDEISATGNTHNDVFAYMSEKECASESHAIGNLKARISNLYATNSESGKVIHLGVVNDPCDCHITVKNVLERFYDLF